MAEPEPALDPVLVNLVNRLRTFKDSDEATKHQIVKDMHDQIIMPRFILPLLSLGPLAPVEHALRDLFGRQPGHVPLGEHAHMGVLAPPQLCPVAVITGPCFDPTVRAAVVAALNDEGPEGILYWHVLVAQMQEAHRLGEFKLDGPVADPTLLLTKLSDVPCGMTVAELAGHLDLAGFTATATSLRTVQWAVVLQ